MYKNQIPQNKLEERKEPKDYSLRGNYYRDQTAIIHSRPFRRLKHKTQVFFSPDNDHICTRIEHVLHVATIAASICKGLNNRTDEKWFLNEDMAYSIGLGHDLGHAPFGHAGEKALNRITSPEFPFIHELNSYRMAEKLYNYGQGLNLTYAVKDGIICHCGEKFEQSMQADHKVKDLDSITDRSNFPSTYEGCIVRFADKVAYLGRDLEDALSGKLINKKDIPHKVQKEIGTSNGEIIHFMVNDIIRSSGKGIISFSKDCHELFLLLKDFNYQHIYSCKQVKSYEAYSERIIEELFNFYLESFNKHIWDIKGYDTDNRKLSGHFGSYLYKMKAFYQTEQTELNYSDRKLAYRIVTDYVSGMTDNYAVDGMKELFIPEPVL